MSFSIPTSSWNGENLRCSDSLSTTRSIIWLNHNLEALPASIGAYRNMYISKLLIFFTVLAVMYTIEKESPQTLMEIAAWWRFAFSFYIEQF